MSQALPQDDHLERAAIDASCRVPVLTFYGSAIFWLLVGTAFAIVASIKMHTPEFMADISFTTFGRIRPAHLNTVIYGWSSMAGIGTSIWLMARLCRARLRNSTWVTAAAVLWNFGVAAGTFGILDGQSTGIEWLEFPTYAALIIFTAFAAIAIWGVDMFANRKPGHVYVSQWYLIAALFWFPWLYSTVQLLILIKPVSGSVQGIIDTWFTHNLFGLWFTPIGLATAYYLIPKVIGRPIHSYYLSILGFWTLALFFSWNGGAHLIGGPVPAWVQAASIVASFMMIVPVITVAINHHMTMREHFHLLQTSPTLRFTVLGAMSYSVASAQGILMAFPFMNRITHFTDYTVGHAHMGMYLFFTMTMFGAMYYIVPRLVGWEWPSARAISIHFWTTAIGGIAMFGALTMGGFIQGLGLNDPGVPFSSVTDMTLIFKTLRSIAGMLMGVGHIAFAYSFILMILRYGEEKSTSTLFEIPAKRAASR